MPLVCADDASGDRSPWGVPREMEPGLGNLPCQCLWTTHRKETMLFPTSIESHGVIQMELSGKRHPLGHRVRENLSFSS